MNFIEYCDNKIKEIKDEIANIESLISENRLSDISNKNRKKIIKDYYRSKGKKLRNIIFPPNEHQLKDYYIELKNIELNQRKEELEKELKQLECIKNSFENKKFTREIIPNDYVVRHIIFYSNQVGITIEETLTMLISLFKQNISIKNSLITEIENTISKNFSDNKILPTSDSQTVIFFIKKLLSLIFSEHEQLKQSLVTNNLYNEIRLQQVQNSIIENLRLQKVAEEQERNNPNPEKEEKESEISKRHLEEQKERLETQKETLEIKKESIKELQRLIKGGVVVSPLRTMKEFERLLDISSIPRILSMDYMNQMESLIDFQSYQLNNTVLKEFLSQEELQIYEKAKKLNDTIQNQKLRAILNRYLKDITSICKYIVQICPPEELQIAYEELANKVYLLNLLMKNIEELNTQNNNTLSFITDSDDFPTLLRSIETIDIVLYPEVFSLLQSLKDSNLQNEKVNNQNGINIYVLSGIHTSIFYTKTSKNIIIIGLAPKSSDDHYLNINKDQEEKITNLLKQPKTKDQIEAEIICENIINAILSCEIPVVKENDFMHLKKD